MSQVTAQALSNSQLEVAVRHHERGEFEHAERLYRQALISQPNNAQAVHCAGVLALQLGRYELAAERLKQSVELGINFAGAYFLLGRAYKGAGDTDTAIEYYKRAVELDPNLTDAYVSLGIALRLKHRLTEAEAAYSRALQLAPNAYEARLNLANVLQARGEFERALQEYERAETLQPQAAELHYNAGKALRALGRTDEAIHRFRRAIQIDSEYLEAYYNLGNSLVHAKHHAQAIECYETLLSLIASDAGRPRDKVVREKLRRDAKGGIAAALIWCLRYEEALPLLEELFQQAAELDPLGLDPLELAPLLELLLVILPFRFLRDEQVRSAYERYQRATPLRNVPSMRPPVSPVVPEKLRIAYLSGDFRDHSVAFFLEPILAHHDKQSFEVVCYSSNKQDDEVTARLRSYADIWVETGSLSDYDLAQRMLADRIDILIDLSGRTTGNRVGAVAHHPALLQINYLGYPTFTGLPQMEYRLTDAAIDPLARGDDSGLEGEHPLRLPGSMFCYRPSPEAPPVADRNADASRICFGSFNQVQKISPETVAAWVQILNQVPHSHLLLKAFGFGDAAMRQRVLDAFVNAGIAADRVSIRGGEPERRRHFSLYGEIDVVLDTFPYNGATTTCEALWMGVPVVTLAGATHASRMGASLLGALNLSELIAETPADYVARAVALATDRTRLRALHSGLRDRFAASPLRDEREFTAGFEHTVRNAWQVERQRLLDAQAGDNRRDIQNQL